ncbi:MAG: FAD-binding oxidoreductase [Proteobacteria bacterium]|nr:FAD-binding oxidoreductase [Pseudomonadota bacterium]MBI3496374.1 FAD-binding oxidoreductase [Pseudomonadota bacterium]
MAERNPEAAASGKTGASVVIIGGGVTGLSAGWWLARSGVDVLVLDKGIVGWEASGRNGGGATHAYSPFFMEEQRLWPQMDELLGYPTEYQRHRIRVALDDAQMERFNRIAAIADGQGFKCDYLDRKNLAELVPLVGDNAVGGLFCHYGGHANPQRTTQAYAWALEDHGGRILQHATVTGITVKAGKVCEVVTDRGRFGCEILVIAAGPQTGLLAAMLGAELPLAPARVEMIVTEPVPLMRYGGVDGNGLYGRQTLRGNLAYGGGPHEWIEIDGMQTPPRVTTSLLRHLGRRLAEMFPKAAHVRIIRSWGGIVENTPDGRPVIDRLQDPSNAVLATMSSVGFGLSPATGRVIMELVRDGGCSFANLTPISLARFRGLPADWRERLGWIPVPMTMPAAADAAR